MRVVHAVRHWPGENLSYAPLISDSALSTNASVQRASLRAMCPQEPYRKRSWCWPVETSAARLNKATPAPQGTREQTTGAGRIFCSDKCCRWVVRGRRGNRLVLSQLASPCSICGGGESIDGLWFRRASVLITAHKIHPCCSCQCTVLEAKFIETGFFYVF